MKAVFKAVTVSLEKEDNRTKPEPAIDKRAKEETMWFSRMNSGLGVKPDSGGETVESLDVFGCCIDEDANARLAQL